MNAAGGFPVSGDSWMVFGEIVWNFWMKVSKNAAHLPHLLEQVQDDPMAHPSRIKTSL